MTTDKTDGKITILIVGSGAPELVEIPQHFDRETIGKILVAHTPEGLIDFARKHKPTIVLFGPSMLTYEGAYLPDLVKTVNPEVQVIVLGQSGPEN